MKKGFILIREKYERITVTHKRNMYFCKNCRKDVDWISADKIMGLIDKTHEEIESLIKTKELDFKLTKDGKKMICLVSALRL